MFAISRAPAAAELPHARAGLGPVATARTRLPRSAASLLLVALPILILAVIAWQRRWVAEDGFINFRVVNNIFAGHGPVFNPKLRDQGGVHSGADLGKRVRYNVGVVPTSRPPARRVSRAGGHCRFDSHTTPLVAVGLSAYVLPPYSEFAQVRRYLRQHAHVTSV